MKKSIEIMTKAIAQALGGALYEVYLYGSAVMGDFRPGWSDIDIFALSEAPLSEAQAEKLLDLRRELSDKYPENPYFRCFEGVIVGLHEYLSGDIRRAVCWGTSGRRITDRLHDDVFARFELARYAEPVFGDEGTGIFTCPTREELVRGVREHYDAIRKCARETDESLYSCGWLLDIARCVYTLRFNDVVSKTKAGEWALEKGLFPDREALERALTIRRSPNEYRDLPETKAWLRSLGPTVQRYADVLEAELRRLDSRVEKLILSRDFDYLQPYFYSNPHALRCELGVGRTREEFARNARARAERICRILFPHGADAFIFNYWIYDWSDTGDAEMLECEDPEGVIERRVQSEMKSFRFLNECLMRYRHVSVKDLGIYDDPDDPNAQFTRRDRIVCYPGEEGFDELSLIDKQIESDDNPEIGLVSFDNECILSVYDDRGCDVVFTCHEKMKRFYPLLEPYFLDHDRAEMEKRLKEGE